jgi:polyphosphate kinase
LLVAPHQLRKKYLNLIQKETENASMGKEAFICAKMNSLVDMEMIDALYEANNAGVKIDLIIRGICSLVPGVEGQSENINAISIVDKYLEHSRVFVFCNEGDTKYYISSADWMVRNLDKRVEVATPIYDPDIQKELWDFMKIQFNDRKKARIINEKQDNPYLISVDDKEVRCQDEIYEYLARKTGQANK